jgi:DNA primase
MGFRKKGLSISEAKAIDMVDYLSGLGYQPTKIRNADYWYCSPLRNEKTPSFKINRKLNCWYDHGIGKGGTIIDFGIQFYGCSVGEFLQKVNGDFSFHEPALQESEIKEKENRITILQSDKLTAFALLRYLEQRRIPVEIARQFCRQVCYQVNGKSYYGIGFQNDSEGYEIRNSYFKASSSPKDITTIKNNSDEAVVFEGFFDFLSFKAIYKNQPIDTSDFVILNSVSFFEKARAFMEQHEHIRLYLDRDASGLKCTLNALSLSKKYNDDSCLYQHHKDLNDWMMNFGKAQKKSLGQKVR